MINLTPTAAVKVKEIMSMQNPVPVALRVAVVGGCSGFQYTWLSRIRPAMPMKWWI
jgi:Fe-S cluster assembly iron-binding protein IscA